MGRLRLRTRLFLLGFLLPITAMALAVAIAGKRFEATLAADLDRRLLGQAAIETVSLFDGADGGPHLHASRSSIAALETLVASGAIYDAQGKLFLADPPDAPVPRVLNSPAPDVPELQNTENQRVLLVHARAPDGRDFAYRLAAPLEPLQNTIAIFYRTLLLVWGGTAIVLGLLQARFAVTTTRRIAALLTHVPQLLQEHGYSPALNPDPAGDELAQLQGVLVDTKARLDAYRAQQKRFVANAAHELRTPLTIIRTEIDLALRKERPAEELRQALREARTEVDRLALLAQQLLNLECMSPAQMSMGKGDLAALVRESMMGLSSAAQAREVMLNADIPASLITVMDALSMRQAVDNVIGNAIKFAPSHSQVNVSLFHNENVITLWVDDAGPGVPEDERQFIFEPFYRGRNASIPAGAGIGLAIVRDVVQLHRGSVACESSPLGGARMLLCLPTV